MKERRRQQRALIESVVAAAHPLRPPEKEDQLEREATAAANEATGVKDFTAAIIEEYQLEQGSSSGYSELSESSEDETE